MFLLVLSFVFLGGDAEAAWTRLRSTNFTFVGDASEGQIRRVAQQLEQFREVMLRALPPTAVSSPAPIVVIVFANDRSFEPFKPRFQGRTVDVAGFFRSGQDTNYIAINGSLRENATRVVFHEYAHFLVRNTLGVAPLWVSEGLAEVYSTFQERDGGKSALLGTAPPEHVRALNSATLIPLAQLMALDQSSPMYNEGNRRGLLYAQSWAFMHYLTFGSETRGAQLLRYLARMRGGDSPQSALTTEFGTDLAGLERELRLYVSSITFPARMYSFETTARADVAAKSEMLADTEAQGYLGDLLARSDRTDDARAYLKKIIASNPDAGRALLALGLLELREASIDTALPLLERAATLMPEDAAALAAYGRGLMERLGAMSSGDPQWGSMFERARSVLSRAAELDPTAAHTLAALAYLELSDGEPRRAVDLLTRAVAAAPADESYRMGLAEALTRQRDYDGAVKYFGLLLAQGSRPEVRERAREGLARVARLRQLETARAAVAAGTEPAVGDTPPESAAEPPSTGSDASGLILSLREIDRGEQRVLGVFRAIQCRQGRVILQVQTATAVMNLGARELSEVDFISYRKDTPGSVNCGAVLGAPPVLVTYRVSDTDVSADGIDGIAVAVELIPDGYLPPDK